MMIVERASGQEDHGKRIEERGLRHEDWGMSNAVGGWGQEECGRRIKAWGSRIGKRSTVWGLRQEDRDVRIGAAGG
jgi:hypothetical protein